MNPREEKRRDWRHNDRPMKPWKASKIGRYPNLNNPPDTAPQSAQEPTR